MNKKYFISTYLHGNPRFGLTQVEIKFYFGMNIGYILPKRRFHSAAEDVGCVLYKNTYLQQRLFPGFGRLFVDRPLFDELSKISAIRGVQVGALHCFRFPYGPGRLGSYKDDESCKLAKSTEDMFVSMQQRYSCPPPQESFYEIVTESLREPSAFSDQREELIEYASGIASRSHSPQVSDEFVQQVGIYASDGWIMSHRVYELLRPHLWAEWCYRQEV